MKKSLTGENNPFYGRHHTEEAKEKNRLAHVGKRAAAETLAKLRVENGGKNNGFYGKKHSTETKLKLSQWAKQRKASKETCLAISAGHLGQKNSFYGKHHTNEAIERNRQAHIGNKATKETRLKMSIKHRAVWSQSIEYKNERVGNIVRGNKQSPNKKELAIWAMLDEIQPNAWSFIGNGKLDGEKIDAFCGKMPDFWNGDHKFIEHWGVYWHRNHSAQERIDLFAEHGYKMLIVPELELMHHPDQVKEKIARFVEA